jgi:hypothetical protein
MRRVRREESVVLLHFSNLCLAVLGEWTSRIVHLLNDHHMGVVTAAASLIGRRTEQLVVQNQKNQKSKGNYTSLATIPWGWSQLPPRS